LAVSWTSHHTVVEELLDNLHRLVGESRQLHNRPIFGLDKIVMAVAMNLCLDLLFLLLLLAIAITNTT